MDGSALEKEQLEALAAHYQVKKFFLVRSSVLSWLLTEDSLGVLNGVNRNLVQVINAIKDTQSPLIKLFLHMLT